MPLFNQIHFPNPKLNPRLKNLINLGTHPTSRGSQLKLRTSVQKFTKFQNYPTQSQINQKFQNSTQVYVHISPTPKIILQAVKQTTTPPHQSLDHPPRPKYAHSTNDSNQVTVSETITNQVSIL